MTVALDPVTVCRPWPFVACPNCGHEEFVVTATAEPVVFTCGSCHSSWRYLLGYLQQVQSAPAPAPLSDTALSGLSGRASSLLG